MKKKQHRKLKTNKVFNDRKDKQTERIVYAVIFLLALFGLVVGYMMMKEFKGKEIQEDGHFKIIEKEK